MALTASFAADFDRFESAIKSATINLGVFDRATGRAMQSLKRETESISGQKLVADAARMAEAVKRLGGDANSAAGLIKLLPSELKRVSEAMDAAAQKSTLMGQAVPESIAKVRSEIAALNQTRADEALKKANEELAKMPPAAAAASVSVSSLAKGFIAAQLTIATAERVGRAFVDFLGSSVSEYLEAEKAQKQLTAALRAQGTATPAVIAQFGDLADQFQRTTVYSDDLITEMQNLLTTVGQVLPSQMGNALKAATDLASGLGIDLHAATMLVAKAMEGNTTSLQKYGVAIDKAAIAAHGADAVFAAIQERFGGQAAAEVDSYAGRLQQLANTWDNVKEALGRTLVTNPLTVAAMRELGGAVKDVGDKAAAATPSLADLTDKLGFAGRPMRLGIRILEEYVEMLNALGEAGDRLRNIPTPAFLTKLQSGFASRPDPGGLAQFEKETKAHAAAATAAKQAQDAFNQSMKQFDPKAAIADADRLVKVLGQLGGPAQVLPTQLATMAASFDKAAEAARVLGNEDLSQQFELLARTLSPVIQLQQRYNVTIGEFVTDAGEYTAIINDQIVALTQLSDAITIGPLPNLFNLRAAFDQFETVTMRRPVDELTKLTTVGAAVTSALKDLPNVIQRALEGGGDLFRSIGASFGSKLFGEGSALVKSMTGGLTKALGTTIGGALGTMLPGLGSLLGAGLGALTDKFFGKLFGGEGKKVNDLRDQFTAAAGGIDTLAQHAADAGLTLDKFYQAKTVKQYEAAIRDLDKAFGDLEKNRAAAGGIFDAILEAGSSGIPRAFRPAIEQLIALGLLTDEQADKLRALGDDSAINLDQMTADIGVFGGRLESLGPAFRSAQIDKTATDYINAIDRLIRGGADIGGVLFDAREEISKLVQDSLSSGTALADNMRPWIEELARSGNLVDANGDKITDLANLKFGDKIETEAEKTQRTFEDLRKVIEDLSRAIRNIPGTIPIRVDYQEGDRPGPRPIPTGPGDEGGSPGRSSFARTGSLSSGTTRTLTAGATATARNVFQVPIQIDGRTVADVVIDQLGNRLSVRGAR